MALTSTPDNDRDILDRYSEDDRSIVVGDEEIDEEEELIPDTDVRALGGVQGIPITCNGAPMTHDLVAIRFQSEKIAAILMNPGHIIALVFTFETVRSSRNQYDEMCRLVSMFSRGGPNEVSFPSYSTLMRKVEALAIQFLYAGSCVHTFCSNKSPADRWECAPLNTNVDHDANPGNDARIFNETTGQSTKELPVVIVAPSQWALMDVSTGPIYRAMFGEGVESRECECECMGRSSFHPSRT
jgi:hypothetical protein